MAILELIEFLELGSFIMESGMGWRFLISPRFRRRTVERWRRERGLTIAAEVIGGTFGILATTAGVLWFGYAVLQ